MTARCIGRSSRAASRRARGGHRRPPTETGTTISFLPDPESSRRSCSPPRSVARLRETAFLTRGLKIVLRDERVGGRSQEFRFEGGISDFVEPSTSEGPDSQHVVYFDGENEQGAVEVALQWNASYVE